jgi:hypothetical protein
VADEDQRVVLGPEATLGREPPEPVDPVGTDLVVRPLGGRDQGVRDPVRVPGEGRRVVEVGDGDVGVALDDDRAGRLELAPSMTAAGSGPLST